MELDSYTTALHAVLGLYASIGQTRHGVDLVVTRPEILARERQMPTSVYARALAEGRVLYQRLGA